MYKEPGAELTTEENQDSEPPSSSALTLPQSSLQSETSNLSVQNSNNWNDWKWQIKNCLCTFEQLANFLPFSLNEEELRKVIRKYPMAITPYYASLIRRPDISDPIFAMCVPQLFELFDPPCLSEDPLEEHQDMPVPGLVHRYQDRALLIVTTTCVTYCRHCTRKRVAGKREVSISPRRLQQVCDYLSSHPEICDVIISGGDPLSMTNDALEAVISKIRSVQSVQIIRIGTRVPVVLPMRITDDFVNMLRKYHPIWINTHFNHPIELTKEAFAACAKMANAGIPLGNQTVLLRGVNDNPQIIEQLCRGLVRMRVRPYYLYQCDLVRGVEHFRTPLAKGIEIMEYLRGRVSGLAIPTFAVDTQHGGGKIPILPNYIVSMSPTHTVLRNYEGLMVNYPEPGIQNMIDLRVEQKKDAGVWELSTGCGSVIQPLNTVRGQRRQKMTERKRNSEKGENNFLFDA